ncbi:MAG: 4Fe-4S binding protein [Candidatus Hodarchaeota archaeon]
MELQSSRVLTIGAGIAGTTVTMALADLKIPCTLLDIKPTIGGTLLDLGVVFPTDDCALCYEASTEVFSDCVRRCQYRVGILNHPYVQLLPQTQIESLQEVKDGIQAQIKVSPQPIQKDKCVDCGLCLSVCPLDAVKKVHPQGIPHKYIIDLNVCDRSKCQEECVKSCKIDAIDFSEKTASFNSIFDVVVITTGFTETRPGFIPYGLETNPNVITQTELGRKIDPMQGHNPKEEFTRADGRPIKHVSMIQCVGERDARTGNTCSSICCAFSLKHAIILRKLGIDVTFFYMDIRTLGTLEEYFERARNLGVKFIRGRPSAVEKTYDGTSQIFFENTLLKSPDSLQTDLVVLATKLNVAKPHLKTFEVSLDSNKLFQVGDRIQNIPQTVNQAKATAFKIMKVLNGKK